MAVIDKIQKDLHEAMKSKEKERINALRNMIEKLKYKTIEKSDDLTEEEEVKVIRSLAKQRKESIAMYDQGGRGDLVKTESKELRIIDEYLPREMTEEEIQSLAQSLVVETGAKTMDDLRTVMPLIMKKGSGRIDGKLAQSILREILSKE